MGTDVLQKVVSRARRSVALFCAAAIAASSAFAVTPVDPIAAFPDRVHKFQLKNGLRVLVVERPDSPTIAFQMYIRTGGMDDEMGRSGLAHMFEHMLFKGTKTIGTSDYKKEAKILDRIDQVQAEIQAEKDKGDAADPKRMKDLQDQMAALDKEHQKVLVPEEFWSIYERAGGTGMNASTGYDYTNYEVSLPKNAFELWAAMESDRIKNPVLREFYKERSVVMEERRMRIENSPEGKLWEAFLAAAFMAHPYGRPIVGWESDISRVTRADATRFFAQHYDVSRLVVAIVGGVKTKDVEAMMHKYFDSIPNHPVTEEERIPVEPPQSGVRRVEVPYEAEPSLMIGFHIPDMKDPDNAPLSALMDILGSGRSCRFYRDIVEKKRSAAEAWAGTGPGSRDPNLAILAASPRSPHTTAEVEKDLLDEVEAISKTPPTADELQKVKNQLEADTIRGMSTNDGLAGTLAFYESVAGDWQFLLRYIQQVRALKPEDISRVAREYLKPENRTVAEIVPKTTPAPAAEKGGRK